MSEHLASWGFFALCSVLLIRLLGVNEQFVRLSPPDDVISQRAEIRLTDLEASLQELEVLCNAVAEFFCEDPAAFKLEECCSIFHSFCKRFEAAVRV